MSKAKNTTISSSTADQTASSIECPDCHSKLQKCLIQQNYAMVVCPNVDCGYPFTHNEVIDNLVYVDDNEIIEGAKERLRNE